jgi:hypothetical protein
LTARAASPNDPGPGARLHRRAEPMEECVLIDHRYYRIKPGLVPAHLEIYEKHGFDDVADRAKKRAAMAADPEWQNYLRLTNEAGYTVSQQNNLMLPTKFAPITR